MNKYYKKNNQIWLTNEYRDYLIDLIEIHYFIYGMKIHNLVEHLDKLHCIPLWDIECIFNSRCKTCGKTQYQVLIDNEDKQICKDMGIVQL